MPLRLLILEDQRDFRELLVDYFSMLGVDVRGAGSAREATVHLRSWTPTLILSDIGLPGVDGLEALPFFRHEFPALGDAPAIAMTAYEHHPSRREIEQAGYARILKKPFSLADLQSAMNALAPA